MKEALLTDNSASRRMNFGIGVCAGIISSTFVSSALGVSGPVMVPGVIVSFCIGMGGMIWGAMDSAYYRESIGINLKKFGQGAGLAFAIASGSGVIASLTHDDPVASTDRAGGPRKVLMGEKATECLPVPSAK